MHNPGIWILQKLGGNRPAELIPTSTRDLNQLPLEIWEEIISYIGVSYFETMHDLLACCLTCRNFVDISRKFIFQDVQFRHDRSIELAGPRGYHDYTKFIRALRSNVSLSQYLRKVTLWEGVNPQDPFKENRPWLKRALPRLAPHLNHVVDLTIYHLNWDVLKPKAANSIFHNLGNLQTLCLWEATFPSFDAYVALVSSFPRLSHLDTSYTSFKYERSVIPAVPISPFIQKITTSGYPSYLWLWMMNQMPQPQVRTLRGAVSDFPHNSSLAQMIVHYGVYLTEITLDFNLPEEPNQTYEWNLSMNTVLKTLHLYGASMQRSTFLWIVAMILDTVNATTVEQVGLSIGTYDSDTSDTFSVIDTTLTRPNWLVSLREVNIRRDWTEQGLGAPPEEIEVSWYFPRLSNHGVAIREVRLL